MLLGEPNGLRIAPPVCPKSGSPEWWEIWSALQKLPGAEGFGAQMAPQAPVERERPFSGKKKGTFKFGLFGNPGHTRIFGRMCPRNPGVAQPVCQISVSFSFRGGKFPESPLSGKSFLKPRRCKSPPVPKSPVFPAQIPGAQSGPLNEGPGPNGTPLGSGGNPWRPRGAPRKGFQRETGISLGLFSVYPHSPGTPSLVFQPPKWFAFSPGVSSGLTPGERAPKETLSGPTRGPGMERNSRAPSGSQSHPRISRARANQGQTEVLLRLPKEGPNQPGFVSPWPQRFPVPKWASFWVQIFPNGRLIPGGPGKNSASEWPKETAFRKGPFGNPSCPWWIPRGNKGPRPLGPMK